MARRKILPRTTIFIACEGRNTEPNYFGRIKEEVEEFHPLSITIYPDRDESNPKTDAVNLVREAVSKVGDFDEAWVIFDKDGYTRHPEAFKLANEHGVRIAFSSIAFEHWILLHFERNDSAFVKSADIVAQRFCCPGGCYPGYNKSGQLDPYPYLKGKTSTAIENAAWLRFRQRIALERLPAYDVNPYTDVDNLVKRLLFDNDDTVLWLPYDDDRTIKNASVTVCHNGGAPILKVSNRRKAGIVSVEFKITFIDNASAVTHCPLDRKLIAADSEAEIELSPTIPNIQVVRVEFENFTLNFTR